ncbi:MAG: DNA ligase [Firmicutes bacterium]|nr:DNA ligase [Bacillota bacterium]
MNVADRFIPPMLAITAREVFSGADWWFEIKWDGYRALAHKGQEFHLFSRHGRDLTQIMPMLGLLAPALPEDAIVDGELIKWVDGQARFQALRQRDIGDYKFIAFDCLYSEGRWLLDEPLARRQEVLRRRIQPSRAVIVSDGIAEAGEAYFLAAQDQGLEGVMAKRLTSVYRPGQRTPDWQKFLVWQEERLWATRAYGAGGGAWFWEVASRPEERRPRARVRAPKCWVPPLGTQEVWFQPPMPVTVQYREKTHKGGLRHARVREWPSSRDRF